MSKQRDTFYIAFDIETKGCDVDAAVMQVGYAYTTATAIKEKKGHVAGSFEFVTRDQPMEPGTKKFWDQHAETYKRIQEQAAIARKKAGWTRNDACVRLFYALALAMIGLMWSKAPTAVENTSGGIGLVLFLAMMWSYTKPSLDRYCQWMEFESFLNELHRRFPQSTHKWIILSDNPAFDIAKIDFQRHSNSVSSRSIRHAPGREYISIDDPTEQIKGMVRDSQELVKKRALALHAPSHDAKDDALYILQLYIEVRRHCGEFMSFS